MFSSDPKKLGKKLANEISRNNDREDLKDRIVSLLAKGADLDEEGDQYTPLCAAIVFRKFDVTQLLVARGADINKASRGTPPIFHAIGDDAQFNFLLEKGAEINANALLALAAGKNNVVYAQRALDMGADINVCHSYYTPAGIAIDNGYAPLVRFLLEKGAHAGAKLDNKSDERLLHKAAYRDNIEIVRMLVEHGADMTVRNSDGRTPLEVAQYYSRNKIAEYLEEQMKIREREKSIGWHVLAPDEIAHVSTRDAIGYKLTEIFNFRSGLYTQIAANLNSGVETQSLLQFSDCAEKSFIEEAAEELYRRGGRKVAVSGKVKMLGKTEPGPGAA